LNRAKHPGKGQPDTHKSNHGRSLQVFTAFWISATNSLRFSAANSKNQKRLNETRRRRFLSHRFAKSRIPNYQIRHTTTVIQS
jgi:hypothetical protein